jgi:hypothetical protein
MKQTKLIVRLSVFFGNDHYRLIVHEGRSIGWW